MRASARDRYATHGHNGSGTTKFHFPSVGKLPRVDTRRNPRAVSVLTPRARPNSRAGGAEKRCAAQAEYGRLAAQAYSPSDAMSQARFCLDGIRKVQCARTNLAGNLSTETGPCGRRICSRGRGGSPDFPRRRRPRCIAPCGGVVGPGGAARRLRPHAHLSLVGSIGEIANAERSARAAGVRDRAAWRRLIPGALDRAAAAAYGAATARPVGPVAAPAGAPGCGRGSTVVRGDGRHAAEASAGWALG